MTVHRLGAGEYDLLADYVTVGTRQYWIEEVEEFLTQIAPSGIGDARGTSLVLVRIDSGEHIAAAAFRRHHSLRTIHVQAFVVRPSFRGSGLAVPAFIELRNFVLELLSDVRHVTWSVRHENEVMLRVSRVVGDEFATSEEFAHFVFP